MSTIFGVCSDTVVFLAESCRDLTVNEALADRLFMFGLFVYVVSVVLYLCERR